MREGEEAMMGFSRCSCWVLQMYGWGGIWEFEDYVHGPAFVKRKLMGFGVNRWVRVQDSASRPKPIHAFQENLISLSNVNGITLSIWKLIHQVGGFAVSEGRDGIGQVDVRANE